MAAFTEGFSYHGNNVDVVSKVLAARLMAKSEREYAEKVLAAQQKDVPDEDKLTLKDFGIKKGYFFRKALKHEFGGDYYLKKKEKVSDIIARVKLLKNPRKNFFKLFEKKQQSTKFSRFRKQFDYKFETSDTGIQATSQKIPGTAKKIQKATTGSGKRISKEQLLGSITDIVNSIGAVAASIQSSSSDVKQNIIASNIAQTNIADQLQTRNETLADKLDKIAAAISQQTQLEKQTIDKKEDKQTETQLESQKAAANTFSFDNLSTKEDESKQGINVDNSVSSSDNITPVTNIINTPSLQRPMGGYPSPANIAKPGMDIPQAETGGIMSGPDSGYLANLHGNEMVIPLDNNYTQGQPSAVDGKTRKKPQMFEKGTSRVGGKFGFGMTRNLGISNTTASNITNMSQPLVDAMSLPMMVAGGSVVAATTNLMKNLGESGEELRPEIEKFSRPISDAFGVPPTVMNKAKQGTFKGGKQNNRDGEVSGESNKNIFTKLLDGFGALMEKLKNSVNNNPPPPPGTTGPGAALIPGDAPPEIKALMETISGGEGGPNSVQGIGEVPGLSDMTIDQAITKAKSYIGKGSETGALGSYQQHSDYLRGRAIEAGLDPTKDKFSLENQTKIQRNFMVGLYGQTEETMARHLREGKLESDIFPKLSRNSGWPSLPGGSQPNVHTPGSAGRYKANLKKYQAAATPPQQPSQQPTSTSLGQQITEKYGMNTNDKFYFKLGGIEYNAYKTTQGFDFYKGSTKVTDPEEEKKVIQGFVNLKTRALQASQNVTSLAPPSSREARTTQQFDALNKEVGADSESSVAFLNMGSSSTNKPSLNVAPPTSVNTTIGRGYDPLDQSGLFISQVG